MKEVNYGYIDITFSDNKNKNSIYPYVYDTKTAQYKGTYKVKIMRSNNDLLEIMYSTYAIRNGNITSGNISSIPHLVNIDKVYGIYSEKQSWFRRTFGRF